MTEQRLQVLETNLATLTASLEGLITRFDQDRGSVASAAGSATREPAGPQAPPPPLLPQRERDDHGRSEGSRITVPPGEEDYQRSDKRNPGPVSFALLRQELARLPSEISRPAARKIDWSNLFSDASSQRDRSAGTAGHLYPLPPGAESDSQAEFLFPDTRYTLALKGLTSPWLTLAAELAYTNCAYQVQLFSFLESCDKLHHVDSYGASEVDAILEEGSRLVGVQQSLFTFNNRFFSATLQLGASAEGGPKPDALMARALISGRGAAATPSALFSDLSLLQLTRDAKEREKKTGFKSAARSGHRPAGGAGGPAGRESSPGQGRDRHRQHPAPPSDRDSGRGGGSASSRNASRSGNSSPRPSSPHQRR